HALAAANFGNGVIEIIALGVGRDGVALAEAVDRALDGAQRLAAAGGRLCAIHLVAQIAYAARQTAHRRLFWRAICWTIVAFDFIEQGNQLATQGLPFARIAVVGRFGIVRKRISARHVESLSTRQTPRDSTRRFDGTLGKTW